MRRSALLGLSSPLTGSDRAYFQYFYSISPLILLMNVVIILYGKPLISELLLITVIPSKACVIPTLYGLPLVSELFLILLCPKNCITEVIFRLAQTEKPQFTFVNEDFEGKRNAEITPFDNFYFTTGFISLIRSCVVTVPR